MTSILGYADLLRRGTLSPEEQASAADYIFSEGKRLERLSLKLLDLYLAQHQQPALFRSLLLNLVDNSRKALEKGGRIALTCTMTETGCRLTVEDNGRGMPPEVLAHLTEAFYRVDKSRARAQGGAGLGLALCERIAVLHGGAIHFASTPGQGTTVTVSLEGGRP